MTPDPDLPSADQPGADQPKSAEPPARAPLKVGVNLLWLVPDVVGGSEEYTVRLLRGLADLADPSLHVTLFALEDLLHKHPDLGERFEVVTLALHGRLKPLRVLAETTWLARQVRRAEIEVMVHAGGVVPPLTGGAATVLTVHDLQPLDRPENFSRIKATYLGSMLPRSIRRADIITTPSHTTAAAIAERFGVAPERLHPVHHGIAASMFDPVPPGEVERVAGLYGLRGRWLLYPVITYPHKEHATLIAAFEQVADAHPDVDLVLTGGEGPAEDEVRRLIEVSPVGDRIRRLGRVPRADLDALLAGAASVTFPSSYEGFGNGALEGLARATPVVAADATSLPEVVGPGGLYAPVRDVPAWGQAIGRILDDEPLRTRLASAGQEHARRFTDADAAERLRAAISGAATS